MYKFPLRTPALAEVDTDKRDFYPSQAEEKEQGMINGIKASSEEEYRVAQVLWKMNRDFRYQHSLFGGRQRRGGLVVDFLVEGYPLWIPLEVVGLHWHTGKHGAQDRLRYSRIEKYLGHPVVFVFDFQLTNDTDAYKAVRDAIGPG